MEGDVIGFHRDMELHHRVHAHTHVLLVVPYQDLHVIHPVVMGLPLHVHAHGIAPLEDHFLAPHVIHKVVMELELRAPIHVIQEVPYLVPHVIFHKVRPIHILVHLEAPYLVLRVHSLHQELHNMVVYMVEHNPMVYVFYPQDNVYLPDV